MRVLKDHVHSGHMAGTEHPWTPSLPNTDPRQQPERTGAPPFSFSVLPALCTEELQHRAYGGGEMPKGFHIH